MLNINFDPSYNNPVAISFKTMRRMVGIMGMALPVTACLWSVLFGDCHTLLSSISAYYHTNMRDVFVGILCAVSFFLFAFHGYDNLDLVSFKIAAISALGIAFSPALINDTGSCVLPAVNAGTTTNVFHNISAAVFFITLAFISLRLFTKSNPNKPKEQITIQKQYRNRVYKICGSLIVLCIVLLSVIKLLPETSSIYTLNPVFWLETIALFSFGTSWLVKGETIFKDDAGQKS